MTNLKYKDHQIFEMPEKIHTVIKVYGVRRPAIRPLYGISGQFGKDGNKRPHITTIEDAKRWINEHINKKGK